MYKMFFVDRVDKKGYEIVSTTVRDGMEIVLIKTPLGVKEDFAENGEILIFNSGY